MISEKPTIANMPLEAWLKAGAFPPGITKAAIQVKKDGVEPPTKLLEGFLLYVPTGRKGEDEREVGRILASLHPHAETAIFSPGLQGPMNG